MRKISACSLLHYSFLLGLILNHEYGATYSSETLVDFLWISRSYIPEKWNSSTVFLVMTRCKQCPQAKHAIRATYFMLVSCLAQSSILKIEATCSSENSVNFQRTMLCYIPEDRVLHKYRCEKVKSYTDGLHYRTCERTFSYMTAESQNSGTNGGGHC
jgi:hypothetical protein